jgi:hypothetical protein
MMLGDFFSFPIEKETHPHPSARLRRLRTGRVNIGRFA